MEAGEVAIGNKRIQPAEWHWDSGRGNTRARPVGWHWVAETHKREGKRERARERKRGREREREGRLKARLYYMNRLLRTLLIAGGMLHLYTHSGVCPINPKLSTSCCLGHPPIPFHALPSSETALSSSETPLPSSETTLPFALTATYSVLGTSSATPQSRDTPSLLL